MKHGKHYIDAAKQVDSTKLYDVNEALELACKLATAKFDETVELHVRLGVDGRHADQQVRGAVVLPNGTGKTVRVCAIAKGPAASAAEAAGADIVGDDDLIAKIQGGFMDFDVVVTTPDMMGKVGRLGKLLGPRGLMPNPKAGTVTPDLGKAVKEAKAGQAEHHPCSRRQGLFRRREAVHQPRHRHGRHRQGQARRRQGHLLQERDHRHHHGPWHPSQHPEVRRLIFLEYFRKTLDKAARVR